MSLFELGQALKLARIRQSLTQHELATRTGVSLSTISGLERGTLTEIGTVKLSQLFSAVGLELQPLRLGQRRTLDDVHEENMQRIYAAQIEQSTLGNPLKSGQPLRFKKAKSKDGTNSNDLQTRQRVRHTKNEG
jgi:transcriptional regulator with XRE-family HTH domain